MVISEVTLKREFTRIGAVWVTGSKAGAGFFLTLQGELMSENFRELLETFHQTGRVRWIGLRSGRHEPVIAVDEADCSLEEGLVDDRYSGKAGGKRMVTLIQYEHLGVVASLLEKANVDPALLRRNIAVSGINLHALRKQKFRIGEAILQGTGDCEPCSQMEEALGPGGYQAMRGHGGITATVLRPGKIRVGDSIIGLGGES